MAHNPARPFVVVAGGLAVRAVGTAFAVQVGPDPTAVLVTAGRVSVDPDSAANPSAAPTAPLAFVAAGQSIDVRPAQPGSAPVVVPLPAADMAGGLAWRHRRVEFSSAPLVDVVAVVNRHNRVQFFIEDPELALVPLSGVFRLDDPGEFAHLLASGFALTAERRGPDLIVLRPRR